MADIEGLLRQYGDSLDERCPPVSPVELEPQDVHNRMVSSLGDALIGEIVRGDLTSVIASSTDGIEWIEVTDPATAQSISLGGRLWRVTIGLCMWDPAVACGSSALRAQSSSTPKAPHSRASISTRLRTMSARTAQ